MNFKRMNLIHTFKTSLKWVVYQPNNQNHQTPDSNNR
eukprot:UN09660